MKMKKISMKGNENIFIFNVYIIFGWFVYSEYAKCDKSDIES